MSDTVRWILKQALFVMLSLIFSLAIAAVLNKEDAESLAKTQTQMQATLKSFNPWEIGLQYRCIASYRSDPCRDVLPKEICTEGDPCGPVALWFKHHFTLIAFNLNMAGLLLGSFIDLLYTVLWRSGWTSRLTAVLQLALGAAVALRSIQWCIERSGDAAFWTSVFVIPTVVLFFCLNAILCACALAWIIFGMAFAAQATIGLLLKFTWLATAMTGYWWLFSRLFETGLERVIDGKLEFLVSWMTRSE
jgi:hypothetical protein